jgi:hypothetical protein
VRWGEFVERQAEAPDLPSLVVDHAAPSHAELLGDALSACIVRIDVVSYLRQSQGGEGVPHHGLSHFGRHPLAPHCFEQPPLEERCDVASRADTPVAKPDWIGSVRPRFDEGPVGGRVGPRSGNEMGYLQIAIHRQTDLGVSKCVRTEQQEVGVKGRLPVQAYCGEREIVAGKLCRTLAEMHGLFVVGSLRLFGFTNLHAYVANYTNLRREPCPDDLPIWLAPGGKLAYYAKSWCHGEPPYGFAPNPQTVE